MDNQIQASINAMQKKIDDLEKQIHQQSDQISYEVKNEDASKNSEGFNDKP